MAAAFLLFRTKGVSVRVRLLVCTCVLVFALPAFAQADEWWRLMQAGFATDRAGDYAKSLTNYRQAIQASEKLDASDIRRVYAWNGLAKTQDVLGNYAGAEAGYRRALKAAEQTVGKRNSAYILVLENLATLYAETCQYSRAERFSREALQLASEVDPPDQLGVALARSCLAAIVDTCGKHDEAARLASDSLPVLERNSEVWGQTVGTLNTMASALYAQGKYESSEKFLLKALAAGEQNGAADHPLLARILCNLAMLALRDGRYEEAGQRFQRALRITESRLGIEHPMYGILLGGYASYLRQTGDKSRARALEAQSSQILKDTGRRNGLGAMIDVSALQRK
jgi:tetratricopeptide (TPR) repeat protein